MSVVASLCFCDCHQVPYVCDCLINQHGHTARSEFPSIQKPGWTGIEQRETLWIHDVWNTENEGINQSHTADYRQSAKTQTIEIRTK